MQANGMRLLKLINDLLDLVKLESGRMKARKEPLEMEGFIKGLIESVQGAAKDKEGPSDIRHFSGVRNGFSRPGQDGENHPEPAF